MLWAWTSKPDVQKLDRNLNRDVCDAQKDARDDILDRIADCPLEFRQVVLAAMKAAIASMGC